MKKIIITDEDNGIINNGLQYIIGFGASLWGIIIDKKEVKIILDARYFENTKNIDEQKVKEKIGRKLKITYIKFKGKLIDEIIKQTQNSKIELEDNITLKYFETIKKKYKKEIKISPPFFQKQRIIKQTDEKDNIKKTIQIIDQVWKEIEKLIHTWKIIWKTEKEVRAFIVNKILEFSWEWESFEAIVAFWKNSAIPHHTASDTIIWNGPLLIDMGALYNWYCSDFTRTAWVWEKNQDYQEFQKVHQSVKKAHEKALQFAKAWVEAKEIDKVTRESITQDGYWEYFTHSTWHGVGLNIHEEPRINKKSKNTIEENMIFTIEPGIYLPWKFGVRLENIVFTEKDWVKCWSEVKL
jgi:Xaa-Pro aminopeptidase